MGWWPLQGSMMDRRMGQTEVGGQKGTGFIRTTVFLHKVHLLQDGAVSGAFFK